MLWVILGLCVLNAAAGLGCLLLLAHSKEVEKPVPPQGESEEEAGLRESILNLMRYQAFEEKRD